MSHKVCYSPKKCSQGSLTVIRDQMNIDDHRSSPEPVATTIIRDPADNLIMEDEDL